MTGFASQPTARVHKFNDYTNMRLLGMNVEISPVQLGGSFEPLQNPPSYVLELIT